ncbi:MAG: thiamine pyrophosphate-binding protein [Streptosporangiales bacterium]|nr:thiamine pyrophosphate-binding protein [Streptosporangiales bacterium]
MSESTASSRTGASVVADTLGGYGVTHIFQVPAVIRRSFAEMERRQPQISRITTHGEKSAAYMADGYARVAHRPGVCAAQVIGALNLCAGLREPFLAGSPVIAITGGRDPATKFRHVYQEVDDLPAFDQVTKFNGSIDDVSRFSDMFRHAFRVATTGHPGPVHLQVQGNEGQLDGRTGELQAVVEPSFAEVPAYRPVADDESLLALLHALAAAERPIIVAGGGVRSSRAGAELVALAEALSVPVATSANGKDVIPGTHPLSVGVCGTYSRQCANDAVTAADLVFFVGTKTGGMTTHFWTVPPLGSKAVQLDIEPQHIGRNYPVEVAVLADARTALRRMLELLDGMDRPARSGWLARVDTLMSDWAAQYREVLTSSDVPVRPERLCGELTTSLPADAVVVVDTGHAGMWMAEFHDVTSTEQDYLRSAGHLGWAFPAGIGAKAAAPERPTFVFTGDSGIYYHLAEIETAVRWRINSITVVNNNDSGNQSKRGFDRAYDGQATPRSREMWTFEPVDFAKVAENLGAVGIRVDKPAELPLAFERAMQADRPVVIDVHTDIAAEAPLAGA